MAAPLSSDLAKQWRQQRFNPLRHVTPQSAGAALDQFDAGWFRAAALMWEQIEERDDVAVTVCEKRRSKVASCKWDVLVDESAPAGKQKEAVRHQEALKAFYSGLSVRSAIDRDVEGGVKLMVERLMDGRLVKYAPFEIVWRGGLGGLRAELWHVPLYFFEGTQGELRYAGVNGTGSGVALDRANWLIGVGKPLMKAVTVAYIFKRLSLADWLNLSEKFGIPGVQYETLAKRGTDDWKDAVRAAESFANDWILVTTQGEKVNLLTVGMTGDGPFAPMVERMDRAMTRIVMGADLATMSRIDGTGASLQGDETDDLVAGDCEWVSETVQRQLDRRVIEWAFGRGVEPLAFFQVMPPADEDTKLEMEVDNHVAKHGVVLTAEDVAERFGRTHAGDEETEEEEGSHGGRGGHGGDGGGAEEEDDPAADNERHSLKWPAGTVIAGKKVGGDFRPKEASAAPAAAETLLDLARNEGGFTLDADGVSQRSGFAVAPDQATDTRVPLEEFGDTHVRSFIGKFWDLLRREGAMLGGWEEEGMMVLDVSIVVNDREEAIRLAKAGGQDAIFDLANKILIRTKDEDDQETAAGNDRITPAPLALPGRSAQDGDDGGIHREDGGRNEPPRSVSRGDSPGCVLAANTGAADAAEGEIIASNEALSAASFGVLDAGGLVVPFGDYPQTILLRGAALRKAAQAGVRAGPDGRTIIIQRVDAAAGNAMAAELGSALGRVRRMFMGAPVYNGHPFHPDPERRKDYPDKRAFGWIKSIEVGADELRLVPSYNSLGAEAVNDAQLAYHSPEWGMEFVGVENGVGVYRPVRLRSTGLTNEPNIPVPALVSANEGGAEGRAQSAESKAVAAEFLAAAVAELEAAEAADFAPLALRLRDALAANEGDDEGLRAALGALRDDLPELAREVAANEASVAAWERILGAAMGEGLGAAADARESVSALDDDSDDNNEPENDMLKKLLELLAAAGLIQADDPEDAVLTKLQDFKNEMEWKRVELARQREIAAALRATLPAANVAEIDAEALPLADELITVAANEITTLRSARDEAAALTGAFREALADAQLDRLLAANEITGAEVDELRGELLACNDAAAFAERLQKASKPDAGGAAAARVTAELGGGKAAVIAANDAAGRSRCRQELVNQHLARITGGKAAKQGQYEAAWNAARKEKPELF